MPFQLPAQHPKSLSTLWWPIIKKTKPTNQHTLKCSLQRQVDAFLSLTRWHCQSTIFSPTAKDTPMGRPGGKGPPVHSTQVCISHLWGRTSLDGTQLPTSLSHFTAKCTIAGSWNTQLYPTPKLNDPFSMSLAGVLDSGPYSPFVQILKCKMINSSISPHTVPVSRTFFLLRN